MCCPVSSLCKCAVQLPAVTKAITTLVRLGLVTEFCGKFATNHKRSGSPAHMGERNELGRCGTISKSRMII